MALIVEQAMNFAGFQRDIILSDIYYYLRGMLNRVHYTISTQNKGLNELADIYWLDAINITHRAHKELPKYAQYAWSEPNGIVEFSPNPHDDHQNAWDHRGSWRDHHENTAMRKLH